VNSDLAACVSYLTGKGGDFPPPHNVVPGWANWRKVLSALQINKLHVNVSRQPLLARIPDIKDVAASSLPAKCKVQVDFPISKNFNCAELVFFPPIKIQCMIKNYYINLIFTNLC
jgi:hypothetical protein